MTIVLDGTNGINTPDLESSGQVTGTTASFSGNVTLGTSVLATPTGSAPSYTCRAWVNFNGTGTVAIRASGNVSSITDNGTGDYTVNFTTAMPDANYAVTLGVSNGASGTSAISIYNGGTYSTTAVRLSTYRTESGGSTDMAICNVSIFR